MSNDLTWLWPVLLSSGITGVSVGIGFAFAMSRQIGDLRTEIRTLTTRFDGWNVRCELTHKPIDRELEDHKGRLDNHATRLREIEAKSGSKDTTGE